VTATGVDDDWYGDGSWIRAGIEWSWDYDCTDDTPEVCADGEFDCNGDGSECIPGSYFCDGSSEHGNAGWGADCDNGADEVLEDCCAVEDATYVDSGLCGGEADPCVEAGGTPSYQGDGWCDGSNNNEGCGYDSGDCCPSTCVDATYSCDSYGGDCDDCIDPSAEDANYGGSCAGGPVCGDGTCEDGEACGDNGCFADCGCCEGEYTCAAGGNYGDCIPGTWECDNYNDCADSADEADCGGDGGDDCVNDDSTADNWGMTCSENAAAYGGACFGGFYDDDDFDECSQCCACEGDASCASRNEDAAFDKDVSLKAMFTEKEAAMKQAIPTVIDIRTGEIIPGTNASSDRAVSYVIVVSCDACLSGNPYEGEFTTSDQEIVIYGFDEDSEACGDVTAFNSAGQASPTSDEACANAGEQCAYYDCAGTCDGDAVEDCNGDCGGSAEDLGCGCGAAGPDACGTCDGSIVDEGCGCGAGAPSGCDDACGSSAENDCCGDCDGDGSSCAGDGDVNGDGTTNVNDIVSLVAAIVSNTDLDSCGNNAADTNGDGATNVLDVISIIDLILNPAARADRLMPSSVELIQSANALSYVTDVNGLVGFEMTLYHDGDCEFSLTKEPFVRNKKKTAKTTMMLILNKVANNK
jgi:hypothetical protein